MLPGSYWEVARELGDKSYKVTLNSCLDTGHIAAAWLAACWLGAGYAPGYVLATHCPCTGRTAAAC